MNININITSPELAGAINNLAQAIAGKGPNVVPFQSAKVITEEALTVSNETNAAIAAVGGVSAKEQKELLAKQIKELGYEPPASGTVAKFEEALKEAQSKETVTDGLDEEETITEPAGTVTDGLDEEETATGLTGDDLRNALRNCAGEMVKGDPEMGRTKLGAILKKVGCQSITLATEKQLDAIKPLLEKASGTTIA